MNKVRSLTQNIKKYQIQVTEPKHRIITLKNTKKDLTADKMKEKKGSVNLRTGQWKSPNQKNKKKKE